MFYSPGDLDNPPYNDLFDHMSDRIRGLCLNAVVQLLVIMGGEVLQ